MKLTSKKLEDYTKEELRNERFEITSKLIDAWINPDLQKSHRKDRNKKVRNHTHDIWRLIAINELLWQTWDRNNMYKSFLNSLEWEND